MRTMSSPVEMESVSANIVVVGGEMTVVMIQMNNSAVSVFLPDSSVLYCNHLSSGMMANSGFIQVSLYLPCQDINRYSLSISPFFLQTSTKS